MRITVAAIKEVVANRYDVSTLELDSCRRTKNLVRARQVAMYLAREITQQSLPEIGRRFGRDHTTVMHACERITEAIRVEPELADTLDELAADAACKMSDARSAQIEQLAEFIAPLVLEKIGDTLDEPNVSARACSDEEKIRRCKNQQTEPVVQPDLALSINRVVMAITRWESDRFTRGERHALEQLERACLDLKRAVSTPPKLAMKKENHYDG